MAVEGLHAWLLLGDFGNLLVLQSQTSTMNVVNCRWGTDWLLRNGGGFATYFFSCATPLSSPSPPLSPLSDSVASLVEEPVVVSFSSAKLSLFLVVRGREQSKRHAYFFRPFPLITQLKKRGKWIMKSAGFAMPTFLRVTMVLKAAFWWKRAKRACPLAFPSVVIPDNL